MLPVEILDYIFSYLLDVDSLEATMKAHPLFSRIAERHLYANIALHNYYVPDCHNWQLPLEVGQLSNLLSERPHIANYVLDLTIDIGEDDDKLFPFLEAIPSILPLLLKLRSLRLLRLSSLWTLFEEFPNLPENLLLSLAKSIQMPSMKCVDIYGVAIPLSLFHQCCNTVEWLVLNLCTISEPDHSASEVESSSSDCPPLKDLWIIEVDPSLETLVPYIADRCRQLRHFRFAPFYVEPLDLIKPIFESCSNTLTVLNIDMDEFCKVNST